MIFSQNEKQYITIALDIFDKRDKLVVRPELQRQLLLSISDKFQQYTIFTQFTKQEFTIMAAALHYYIDYTDMWPEDEYDVLNALRDKLLSLSE